MHISVLENRGLRIEGRRLRIAIFFIYFMAFKKSPSAPQAPGRLAGGETTKYRSPKLFQPWKGDRPRLRSGALPGQIPIASGSCGFSIG
jgi:hypothetical protein